MLQSLKKLFAGERPQKRLFESVVTAARQPHWYRDGGVPDTLEGRFAMIATLTALLIVRLEAAGDRAKPMSVGLTECFIDEMDGEVRQMGSGDPTISKQVGAMVGALGKRIGRFRQVIAGEESWGEAIRASLYRGTEPAPELLEHSCAELQEVWKRLRSASVSSLAAGEWQ
jgi:cytochrome b pre-mRNA-processing protein 3